MELAFYLVIGAFALVSLIHLLFCLFEKEGLRKATKPFTTLLLTTAILILVLTYPEMPFPKHAIWIAGLLLVIGDLFTLRIKSRLFFSLASVFYAVAHILNAYVIVSMLSYTIAWWIYVAIAGAGILIAFALYPLTRLLFGKIAYLINMFLALHLVNVAFAIMLIIDGKPLLSIAVLIGFLLHFVSDFLLVYTAYGKDMRRRDFYVMLFFYVSQVLVMLGLANTLLLISR